MRRAYSKGLSYRYLIGFVIVFCMISALMAHGAVQTYAADYSAYSNSRVGWGLSYTKDHSTPGGSFPRGESMADYDAYYVGDTSEKVIYLTFDCGYDNGYTDGVLDYLKKKGITAAFFLTKPFVDKHPELVLRMKNEGHLVCNHTVNHKDMTTLSVEKIQSEIKGVEDAVEALGVTLDKFVRPPEGAYSLRTLKVLQDMGYKTIFWSFAAVDWDVNNQPGVDAVYNSFMEKYSNGCIPLLHIISSSSTGAVKPIVESMTELGYRFGSLSELGKKQGKITVSIKKRLIYSGKAVEPKINTTNKGAKLTVNYYKKINGRYEPINGAPSEKGLYYVQVFAEATDEYAECKSEKVHFHIGNKK